jgi:fucose permease
MGTLSLRYTERLIMRFGARRTLLPGLVLIAAGLAMFARVPVHGNYLRDVLPVMILLGSGIGVSGPALMSLAMSGATPQDAGLASGLVNTSVQVGGALGLAVLATLSATRSHSLLQSGKSTAAALTGGYHLAFLIGAGFVAAAAALAVTVMRPERDAAQVVQAERPQADGAASAAAERAAGVEPAYSEAG